MIGMPFRLRKLKKADPHPQAGTNKTIPPTKTPHDPVAIEKELEEKDTELLRIKGFFPIDFFPNELIIRKKTVSVIKRNFLTSNIETFLVKDIGLVMINNAIFFSEIRVSYKAPYEDMIINKLLKHEAKQAKALLDKLMLVKNEDVSDDVITYGTRRDMYFNTAS